MDLQKKAVDLARAQNWAENLVKMAERYPEAPRISEAEIQRLRSAVENLTELTSDRRFGR